MHSSISELFTDLLSPLGLLFQQIEVISSHSVHDKQSNSHVPYHKQKSVPPNFDSHTPCLHLGLVILREALPCVDFFDVGERSASGKIALFDDLPLEVSLFSLFFGREEERCVEFA